MKNTRQVTYRRWGTPAIILEGKWLTKKFGWKIGDLIEVMFQPPREITLTKSKNKNSPKGVVETSDTSTVASPSGKSITNQNESNTR